MTQEEKFLRNVPLPEQTDTYTVISHSFILDKVHLEIAKHGFAIEKEEFTYTKDGEVALSKIYLKTDKDPDMGMAFVWQNSYNKQVKFAAAIGSFIYENNTYCIGTEGMSWLRKHTGTSDQEAENVIEQLIGGAEAYFDKLIEEKRQMKERPLSIEDFGCIMGALYFEHELITPNQASAIRKEYKDEDKVYKDRDTLWGLYKLLMFGIDGMDIRKWVKSQQKLHHMIMTEYAIIADDYLSLGVDVDEDNIVDDPVKVAEEAIGKNSEQDSEESPKTLEVMPTKIPAKEQKIVDLMESAQEEIKEISKVPAEMQGLEEWNNEAKPVSELPETEITFEFPSESESTAISIEPVDEVKASEDVKEVPAIKLSEEQIAMIEEEHTIPLESNDTVVPSDKFQSPQEFVDILVQEANVDPALTEYYAEKYLVLEKTKLENLEAFSGYSAIEFDPKAVASATLKQKESLDHIKVNQEAPKKEKPKSKVDEMYERAKAKAQEADEAKKDKKDSKKVEPVSEIKPNPDMTKPVEIISPDKVKPSEEVSTFNFPDDLDDPKKLDESFEKQAEPEFLELSEHEGIDLPNDIKEMADHIEKKMKELYGEVKPYSYEEVNDFTKVTFDETNECFFIKTYGE